MRATRFCRAGEGRGDKGGLPSKEGGRMRGILGCSWTEGEFFLLRCE